MSGPVSARTSWAAALPAGHRLGLLQLFLPRCEQFLYHGAGPVDVGVLGVDAAQHGLQQRGVMAGEELGAVQSLFQLRDLRAGAANSLWSSSASGKITSAPASA
jgi:hypothetical protein